MLVNVMFVVGVSSMLGDKIVRSIWGVYVAFITSIVIENKEIYIRYLTEILSTSLLLLHTIVLFHS
jgi:hypothetical protein